MKAASRTPSLYSYDCMYSFVAILSFTARGNPTVCSNRDIPERAESILGIRYIDQPFEKHACEVTCNPTGCGTILLSAPHFGRLYEYIRVLIRRLYEVLHALCNPSDWTAEPAACHVCGCGL